MGPMSPMPFGVGRGSLGKCVGGRSPLAGRLLAQQHEPGGMRAGKSRNEGREILPPSSLRVGDRFHGLGEIVDLSRGRTMMLPPSTEQLPDTLATGIASLDLLNALDGITASEGHQRIAAPF